MTIPFSGGRQLFTFTGKFVDPLDLKPEEIDILDIAHALSMKCRYAGHTKMFYSVAQHSIHVADCVKRRGGSVEDRIWGLLHDAQEAYVGDIVKPLKPSMFINRGLPGDEGFLNYDEFEEGLQATIACAFGLPTGIPDIVHESDVAVTLGECQAFEIQHGWNVDIQPYCGVARYEWSHTVAENAFIYEFNRLTHME